jgi:hypothetical protein
VKSKPVIHPSFPEGVPDLFELPYTFAIDTFINYFEAHKSRGLHNQLSLKYRPGKAVYQDGCGIAYNLKTHEKTFCESEFTSYNPDLPQDILTALKKIEAIAQEEFGFRIGRVRLINLKFKTCLSLHVDYDGFRLHIPIITNPKCFFVVKDQLYKMPNQGSLYFLNTKELHTAVNASFSYDRLHLVCGTYSDD